MDTYTYISYIHQFGWGRYSSHVLAQSQGWILIEDHDALCVLCQCLNAKSNVLYAGVDNK